MSAAFSSTTHCAERASARAALATFDALRDCSLASLARLRAVDAAASAVRARYCAADKAGEIILRCIRGEAERDRRSSLRLTKTEFGAAYTCCAITPRGNAKRRRDEYVYSEDVSAAVLIGELTVSSLPCECVGDAISYNELEREENFVGKLLGIHT